MSPYLALPLLLILLYVTQIIKEAERLAKEREVAQTVLLKRLQKQQHEEERRKEQKKEEEEKKKRMAAEEKRKKAAEDKALNLSKRQSDHQNQSNSPDHKKIRQHEREVTTDPLLLNLQEQLKQQEIKHQKLMEQHLHLEKQLQQQQQPASAATSVTAGTDNDISSGSIHYTSNTKQQHNTALLSSIQRNDYRSADRYNRDSSYDRGSSRRSYAQERDDQMTDWLDDRFDYRYQGSSDRDDRRYRSKSRSPSREREEDWMRIEEEGSHHREIERNRGASRAKLNPRRRREAAAAVSYMPQHYVLPPAHQPAGIAPSELYMYHLMARSNQVTPQSQPLPYFPYPY